MTERHRGPWVGLAALLAAAGAVSLVQALKFDFDFHHFYRDAEYVWQHGRLNPDLDGPDPLLRRQLPFYLPAVPVLLAPLAAGGPTVAAGLWALMQVVSLGAVVVGLARRVDTVEARPWVLGVALALGAPAIYESLRFNQLSLPILALLLWGTEYAFRHREARGGALLALAAVCKLLPFVFLPWLLLKRRWRASALFVLAALLLIALPPLLVFGPALTFQYHRQWWTHNVRGAPAAGMVDPALREHFVDHRNQSVPAVVARATDPAHPYAAPWQPVRLSGAAARLLSGAALLLLAGLGVWWLRRPARAVGRQGLRYEFAGLCLAMLILSPLLRQYYLVWALPALVVFANVLAEAALWAARRVALAGLAVWSLSMLAWPSATARVYGANLAALLLMGLLLVALSRVTRGQDGPARRVL